MNTHLDYEALADLAEGLLDDARAASAGEHLAVCAVCRERGAELAEVSRILAEAPQPTMPAELAARIDAALAAEGMASGLPEELHHAIGRPRRARRFQLLSAAAAAVVVLGGGATVAKVMSESSVSADKGQSVATEPSQIGSPQKPEQQKIPGDNTAPTYRVVSTGTDYRDPTLPTQIAALVKRNAIGTYAAAPASGPDLPGCVSAASGGRTPVLVDVGGHYKGSPVTVVVIKGTTPGRYDAILAGPGCNLAHPNVLTHTASN